mmetsp:Transcript_8700/g.25049  ORF Transcript_8700/g.25049 Transcript_8700/m.25049 type:complete len:427 (-) Transcript_8700:537-1817(-)
MDDEAEVEALQGVILRQSHAMGPDGDYTGTGVEGNRNLDRRPPGRGRQRQALLNFQRREVARRREALLRLVLIAQCYGPEPDLREEVTARVQAPKGELREKRQPIVAGLQDAENRLPRHLARVFQRLADAVVVALAGKCDEDVDAIGVVCCGAENGRLRHLNFDDVLHVRDLVWREAEAIPNPDRPPRHEVVAGRQAVRGPRLRGLDDALGEPGGLAHPSRGPDLEGRHPLFEFDGVLEIELEAMLPRVRQHPRPLAEAGGEEPQLVLEACGHRMIDYLAVVDGHASEAAEQALRREGRRVWHVLEVEELDDQLKGAAGEAEGGLHEKTHKAMHARRHLDGPAPQGSLEPVPWPLVAKAIHVVAAGLLRRGQAQPGVPEFLDLAVLQARRQKVLRPAGGRPMQGRPRGRHDDHVEAHWPAARLCDP